MLLNPNKMSSKTASVCLLVAVAISTASAFVPLGELSVVVPNIGIGLPAAASTTGTAAAAGTAASAIPAISLSLPTSLPSLALPSLGLPALPALPALTAVGGTSFVASGGNVAVAAASIAGLAIAKELLILATIHDKNKKNKQRRPKREAVEGIDFSKMFERIAEQDVADCGKLLVCQSFAKTDGQRTGEEKAVVNLFDDLSAIQNNAFGTYQWAAYSGSFKNPVICIERYGQCPVEQSILANLIAPQ